MIADYLDFVASLIRDKLVPRESVMNIAIFEYAWDKLEPWLTDKQYD